MKKTNEKNKLINSPLLILGSVVAGIVTGLFFPKTAVFCKIIADTFMQLMKMCVLPILMFSIAGSFCRLCSADRKQFNIKKMFIIFIFFFVVVFVVFSGVIIVCKPGGLSTDQVELLCEMLADNADNGEMLVDTNMTTKKNTQNIVNMFIPDNIFNSLAQGNSIHILVFFLLIGVASGALKDKGLILYDIADSCFSVCMKILNWVMRLLPVGLFALFVCQVKDVSPETLPALIRYVLCVYASAFFCCVICSALICIKTKRKVKDILMSFKQTFVIAFGTRSSLIAMPSSIETLVDDFSVSPVTANSVIPIGTAIARFSMVGIYVSAAFFSAQLYETSITTGGYFSVLFFSILTAIAGAGSPAMVSLSMLSVVFSPINIPYSTILVMLMSIITIIDPPLTVMNTYMNCAVSILIDEKNIKKE